VIVISTVVSRTSKDAAEDDGSGGGGGSSFLANPRRFNVAVSRARALNIVIGHPVPLAQWPHWRALMRHALARGAFTGAGAAGLDGGDESGDADGDGDGERDAGRDALAATVAALAEATLLGAGHDEARGDEDDAAAAHDVYDERGWRVAL
jgi:putative helicase MOV10L1